MPKPIDNELSRPSTHEMNLYANNGVIVKFKSGLVGSQSNTVRAEVNAVQVAEARTLGMELWQLDPANLEAGIAQLSDNPAIEYIEPNYIVTTHATTPNDPDFNRLWGLNNTGQTSGTADVDIDAPETWDIQTGRDVVVGVIDSGVDYDHPDLRNNMWTNPGEIPNNGIDDDGNGYVDDYYGYDFANDDGDPFDDDSHGTHVAGTIAAEGNNGIGISGVSWSAQIMALKFLDANGSGYTFDAIRAINYAVQMGADLTNNSWGGGGFSQSLYDAIAAAGEADQLFIAAAGNGGSDSIGDDNDATPHYPANYDLDNIISVAATDHNDQLASFSNYGETSVDLGAPGVRIYSTLSGGGYGFQNGTSMAAPHVAGVASLVLTQNPNLSALEVKEAILGGVDPVSSLQGMTVTGGRLNASAAIDVDEPDVDDPDMGDPDVGDPDMGDPDMEYPDIPIGEIGAINGLTHARQTINLQQTYVDPVLIVQPASFNGRDPIAIRIDNLDSDSFEVFLQEPSNLDGFHLPEDLSYLVIEAGNWQLDNGTLIEAGNFNRRNLVIQGSWQSVEFDQSFSDTPAVFSQIQTFNGGDFTRTRQRNTTTSGVQIGMEEQDSLKLSGHLEEDLGYIAIETGAGVWSGLEYEVGLTGREVNHTFETIDFANSDIDTTPQLIASLASYYGGDAAGLRYQNLGSSSFQVKVEEDTSLDAEVRHNKEQVSYLALGGTGLLSGSAVI